MSGFFNLVHVHNKGAAFGLLGGLSMEFTRLFFIASSSLVLGVVGYLWYRLPEDSWQAAVGYSLVMAGALGNLIDRVRLGEVVDFWTSIGGATIGTPSTWPTAWCAWAPAGWSG